MTRLRGALKKVASAMVLKQSHVLLMGIGAAGVNGVIVFQLETDATGKMSRLANVTTLCLNMGVPTAADQADWRSSAMLRTVQSTAPAMISVTFGAPAPSHVPLLVAPREYRPASGCALRGQMEANHVYKNMRLSYNSHWQRIGHAAQIVAQLMVSALFS